MATAYVYICEQSNLTGYDNYDFGHFWLSQVAAYGTIRLAECDFLLVFYTSVACTISEIIATKMQNSTFFSISHSSFVTNQVDFSMHL